MTDMRIQLRWVLPVTQLLICLVVLWPAKGRLLFSVVEAKKFSAPIRQERGQLSEPQRVIVLPDLTSGREQQLEAAEEITLQRMRVPVILNFPAAVAQVPYLLVTRREWLPRGIPIAAWRALSWPIAGLILWWLAGRGIDALFASYHSIVRPRLTWMEVAWAIILLGIGIVTLIGIVTSTPDDRRDKDFMALVDGGLLWGVLAGLVLMGRFGQWRIHKSKAANPSC
jgi:hypothetical protein